MKMKHPILSFIGGVVLILLAAAAGAAVAYFNHDKIVEVVDETFVKKAYNEDDTLEWDFFQFNDIARDGAYNAYDYNIASRGISTIPSAYTPITGPSVNISTAQAGDIYTFALVMTDLSFDEPTTIKLYFDEVIFAGMPALTHAVKKVAYGTQFYEDWGTPVISTDGPNYELATNINLTSAFDSNPSITIYFELSFTSTPLAPFNLPLYIQNEKGIDEVVSFVKNVDTTYKRFGITLTTAFDVNLGLSYLDGYLFITFNGWPYFPNSDYDDSRTIEFTFETDLSIAADWSWWEYAGGVSFSPSQYSSNTLSSGQPVDIMFYHNAPQWTAVIDGNERNFMPSRPCAIAFAPTIELDFEAPILNGQRLFVVDVDNPIYYYDILATFTAIDNVDGDITSNIFAIENTLDGNESIIGDYHVLFWVQDVQGNESTQKVDIIIRKSSKPTIIVPATWSIPYYEIIDLDEFITYNITIFDSYYLDEDITISIYQNTYSANPSALGERLLVFRATDPSGNFSNATTIIEIVDDLSPAISGPAVITKPANSILSLATILTEFSAVDEKAGAIDIIVDEDNYTGHGSTPGTYSIKLSATDPSGNTAYHDFNIIVKDDMPSVLYVKDATFINLYNTTLLTLEDVVKILRATGQIAIQANGQITILINSYDKNEETPGVYKLSFKYQNSAGAESTHEVNIKVLAAPTTDMNINEDLSFWNQHKYWLLPTIIAGGLILLSFVIYKVGKKSKRRYKRK